MQRIFQIAIFSHDGLYDIKREVEAEKWNEAV